ncbi:hypothetical protein BVX98_03650 [bacterium F11]|nr:hypothetical protein BVX98_03650 [bacterium F11]
MTNSNHLPHLPHSPGVYLMRDATSRIIYVGKARDLRKRVSSYFNKSSDMSSKIQTMMGSLRHIDYLPTNSEREALVLERRLINKFQPTFNTMWKDDKSYPFVILSLQEDFPRLYLSRKKKRIPGAKYFGPYPSVGRVRQLLRWAWRKKLFPLRPCDLTIKEGTPLPYQKVKSCLYLHTEECPAPCLGKITSHNYKAIAKRAQWFFEGRKDKLIRKWEREMREFSRNKQFERAAEIRDRIQTVQEIREHITFRQISEEKLRFRVLETRAVQDLRKSLNLKFPPERIECFDISHMQGVEKVASMVRFDHGRPNKPEYRKFIIRTVKGIDDFQSMAEVVGRRIHRLIKEKKPFPDLMLLDGGKGQLSAVVRVLKEKKINEVCVIALAKRDEEVFLPGQSNALPLPKDSPGLLLLRQIRDEAHRFAITFHRKRRQKRTLYQ